MTRSWLFAICYLLFAIALTGCKTYQESYLTPDSFNYTVAVNHQGLSVDQHWFGLSWNLKPGK